MKKQFALIFLLTAFALNVSSQKAASVKSFVQTADHIPGGDRRNDLNGEPCALVKVQVVDDIDRVEGNRIGDIVNKGVEKWVYMCKGSRNMRIHLQNHLPVKIMFQDYQINGLESNRVYELVIETPDTPTPVVKQQTLVINYTPENALLLIDSKPYKGNGRVETILPVGEHRYIIAADGYTTAEGVVKLNEQGVREITERLRLENVATAHQQTEIPTRQALSNDKTNETLMENKSQQRTVQSASRKVSGLTRGFKGYVEVGYALGADDGDDCCALARAVFGHQFNPHAFTGIGAGVTYYDVYEELGIPVFANFRYTFLNRRISPFIDAKAGYSFGDMGGLFLSPSIGCRFAIGKRSAITVSACLDVQSYNHEYTNYYYEYDPYWDDYYYSSYSDSESKTALSLGLKIGFEF